jgi:isocitrate dehydrogenase kinase/phosphatase
MNERLVESLAQKILAAYREYRAEFDAITERARIWFEKRDWRASQKGLARRIDLYGDAVADTASHVRVVFNGSSPERMIWSQVKNAFSTSIAYSADEEVAETFFNSVTRSVLGTVGIDASTEFIWLGGDIPLTGEETPVYAAVHRTDSIQTLFREILDRYAFDVPYVDADGDASRIAERVSASLKESWGSPDFDSVELLEPVFYRNKGAYLVGRIRRANKIVPLILPLLNTEKGIVVDTALLDEDDASSVFGFTRHYFYVKARRPGEVIGFLRSILPAKSRAELYTALGLTKHGKTELYRDLYRHLEHSTDRFRFARGAKGMVMIVFTLPSYDLVFKVIRDRFDDPKNTTRDEVKAKYRMVLKRDRVGRLVDAHEFENLTLERERFRSDLLDELAANATQSVSITKDSVILHHVYTERRVDPLDVFVKEASPDRARRAAIDYGQAIKDLAAANVFPGDLLIKNFGVTRLGRVVFYDYDELCALSDCHFRVMPEPAGMDDEMAQEPWFYVGPNDVFPEEFRSFLFSEPELMAAFSHAHGDLFGVDFWKRQQNLHASGELIDFFPYKATLRFAR